MLCFFIFSVNEAKKFILIARMNYDLSKCWRLWTVARQIQTDYKASVRQNIMPPSTVVGLIFFFPVQTEPGPIDIVWNVCNVTVQPEELNFYTQLYKYNLADVVKDYLLLQFCETSFWWNVFCQKSTSSENQIKRQRRAIQENRSAALVFVVLTPPLVFPPMKWRCSVTKRCGIYSLPSRRAKLTSFRFIIQGNPSEPSFSVKRELYDKNIQKFNFLMKPPVVGLVELHAIPVFMIQSISFFFIGNNYKATR